MVIVPGFISSGLELWDGLKCGKHFFRQRMWGTPAMVKAYMSDRQCWMQHMRLDPLTGMDPPGRILHSFPVPLNLSLPCPFPLKLSLLCTLYNPNQPVDVSRRCSS